MPKASEENTAQTLLASLQRRLKRFADEKSLQMSPARAFLDGRAMHIRVTLVRGDLRDYYAQVYRRHAEERGLHDAWLGMSVNDHEGRLWTITGMDPEAGSRCIRLAGSDGTIAFTTPGNITAWMTAATHP